MSEKHELSHFKIVNVPSTEFQEFGKIPRFSREVIITEKIDGTNGVVYIPDACDCGHSDAHLEDGCQGWLSGGFSRCSCQEYLTNTKVYAGSRTKWITPQDDNHGFAKWVQANRDELLAKLGPGLHYGEWWGSGINRGYGLTKGEKRFSLFNVSRWSDGYVRPACCCVVPVLWRGPMDIAGMVIEECLDDLREHGSIAAPGFMRPEGVVLFHTAGNVLFKKTIEKDDVPKGLVKS